MKKLFLTLFIAFLGIFTANAQVWIGGSTSFNNPSKNIKFFPEIGYTIPNTRVTFAAAADFRYNFRSENYDVMLSPYFRFRICNIEKFSFFMDLTGDFGLSNHRDGFEGYRVGLQPGIAWMATKHWTAAFRFAFIGYNTVENYNDENGQPIFGDRGFNVNLANTCSLGLYYNF